MIDQLTTSAVLLHADNWGFDSPWFWVWRMGMFVFWIVFLSAIFWWFRRGGCGWRRQLSGEERARNILAERFARGEISGEEYRERLEQLR